MISGKEPVIVMKTPGKSRKLQKVKDYQHLQESKTNN